MLPKPALPEVVESKLKNNSNINASLHTSVLDHIPTSANKKIPLFLLITIAILFISVLTVSMIASLYNMDSMQHRYLFISLAISMPIIFHAISILSGKYYVHKNREFVLWKQSQEHLKSRIVFHLWHSTASYDLDKQSKDSQESSSSLSSSDVNLKRGHTVE